MTMMILNLLVLLAFASVFYLLVRTGWSAEIVHGAHVVRTSDGSQPPARALAKGEAKDPVCGMPVVSDEGWAHVFEGRTYRFCSKSCRMRFESAPLDFIPAVSNGEGAAT